jgi:hypothetical protein
VIRQLRYSVYFRAVRWQSGWHCPSREAKMSTTPKVPIIIYCACDASGQGRLSVGYLGDDAGHPSCFHDEERTDGFRLRPNAGLERLAGLDTDREVYLLQPSPPHLQQHAR